MNDPSLFCCNKLWLVILNGPDPASAVQLSEAVVGGRVPRRLAQQTVCGVFGELGVPGNSCELGAQGEAVAVETVRARSVRQMREERRPLRAEGAVGVNEAGGAPQRPMETGIPTVGRFLPLESREEREVC